MFDLLSLLLSFNLFTKLNLLALNMKSKYYIICLNREVKWNDAPLTYFSGREVNTCLLSWRRIDGVSRIVNF
jgi:hypothetical protein